MSNYDRWLQSDRDYEHYHGLDVPTEDEEHDEDMRVEAEIDRQMEEEYAREQE